MEDSRYRGGLAGGSNRDSSLPKMFLRQYLLKQKVFWQPVFSCTTNCLMLAWICCFCFASCSAVVVLDRVTPCLPPEAFVSSDFSISASGLLCIFNSCVWTCGWANLFGQMRAGKGCWFGVLRVGCVRAWIRNSGSLGWGLEQNAL